MKIEAGTEHDTHSLIPTAIGINRRPEYNSRMTVVSHLNKAEARHMRDLRFTGVVMVFSILTTLILYLFAPVIFSTLMLSLVLTATVLHLLYMVQIKRLGLYAIRVANETNDCVCYYTLTGDTKVTRLDTHETVRLKTLLKREGLKKINKIAYSVDYIIEETGKHLIENGGEGEQ